MAEPGRVAQAVALLPPLHALGINVGGQPTHPLYVLGDAPLIEWMPGQGQTAAKSLNSRRKASSVIRAE